MTEHVEKTSYNREFIVLWLGQLIAAIGHGVSSFAIGVYVFELTGKATSVSLVTLFAFLPSILLAPVAGVLADRFDRRLLMIIGDGISGLALAVIYVLFKMDSLEFWHILVCITFSSIFQSLMDPSYRATVTDLLSEDMYSQASGLVQLASAARFLIAPAVSGLIMTYKDVDLALLVDISTVVVTVITTNYVRRSIGASKARDTSDDFWRDFKKGWDFIVNNKGILYLMLLVSLITCYMGFLVVLIQPFMLSIANPKTLGLMTSIAAVGMLISSLILGVKSLGEKIFKALCFGLAIGGIFVIGIGMTENILFITVCTFLFFAVLPILNTSIEVLMRRAIPNETQGRVWGLVGMISQLGYIVAYALAGPLADYIFTPAMEVGGALADTFIGHILGVGPSRGIGLIFVIMGIFIIITGMVIYNNREIKKINKA